MNFQYLKYLINSLPENTKEVSIIEKSSGHQYLFDITLKNQEIYIDKEQDLYFELHFE